MDRIVMQSSRPQELLNITDIKLDLEPQTLDQYSGQFLERGWRKAIHHIECRCAKNTVHR